MVVELLSAVAIALTHQPGLTLHCSALPLAWHAAGAAVPDPERPHIWIEPLYCRNAVRGYHGGLRVVAHEILHVRHDPACYAATPLVAGEYDPCHAWVYRWDDWYAESAVRPTMRRRR
jgi:hypothetical protein